MLKYDRMKLKFRTILQYGLGEKKSKRLMSYKNCRLTFRRWFEVITKIIKYQVTNGFTEEINNKINVIKRVSYGIRTFKIL